MINIRNLMGNRNKKKKELKLNEIKETLQKYLVDNGIVVEENVSEKTVIINRNETLAGTKTPGVMRIYEVLSAHETYVGGGIGSVFQFSWGTLWPISCVQNTKLIIFKYSSN